MIIPSKQTCFGIMLVVFCLFVSASLSIDKSKYFISNANADESQLSDDSDQATNEAKLASAITQVYKHVDREEASRVVRSVYRYSAEHRIEPVLMLGIIAAESGFRRKAVSREGAVGYTQVNARYHRDKIKGRNILNTSVNIEIGSRILSDCFDKYGALRSSLGCYNGTRNFKKVSAFQSAVHRCISQILRKAGNLA